MLLSAMVGSLTLSLTLHSLPVILWLTSMLVAQIAWLVVLFLNLLSSLLFLQAAAEKYSLSALEVFLLN